MTHRCAQRAVGLLVVAMVAGAACSSDTSSSASPHRIAVVSGEAQLADAHDTLPRPVRFAVTDAKGKPVGGITVTFAVTLGDGSITDAQQVTGTDGTVETTWVMGAMPGVHVLEARVSSGLVALATAVSCVPGECYPDLLVDEPINDATLLTLATYDSSGQTVHPDLARGHGTSRAFWLAITPYPGGDISHENPSIFRSTDASSWLPPAGVTNPLAWPLATTGYLSDPDITFNPSDQRLWLYYRAYSSVQNVISVIRSANGITWDPPVEVLKVPSHGVVSPAVVRIGPAGPWEMWSVNAGPQGCSATSTTVERRTSVDGLAWSSPAVTDLAQPGQTIWHIDVQWLPGRGEYWAIYNTYPAGTSCATHSLYLARSTDGVHWITSPSPIARSGLIPAFSDVIYRSTLLSNSKGTRVLLMMSGAFYGSDVGYVWRTALISTNAAELLAIANRSAPVRPAAYRALPPPESGTGP